MDQESVTEHVKTHQRAFQGGPCSPPPPNPCVCGRALNEFAGVGGWWVSPFTFSMTEFSFPLFSRSLHSRDGNTLPSPPSSAERTPGSCPPTGSLQPLCRQAPASGAHQEAGGRGCRVIKPPVMQQGTIHTAPRHPRAVGRWGRGRLEQPGCPPGRRLVLPAIEDSRRKPGVEAGCPASHTQVTDQAGRPPTRTAGLLHPGRLLRWVTLRPQELAECSLF